MEEGRRGGGRERDGGWGGWLAVFSRRSFLCVGLMAPSGGRVPQSNLLSPQNTLCYKTHTPSGTDSALNFLPVILAAGQRKKQLPNSERDGEDNHSPLRSRVNNHAFMVQERCCVRAEERGDDKEIWLKQLVTLTDENVKYPGTNYDLQNVDK